MTVLARDRDLTAWALLSLTCLTLALAGLCEITHAFLRQGEPHAPLLSASVGLLAVSSVSLLTMALTTLGRRDAYDWSNQGRRVSQPLVRWPLTAGWGVAVVFLFVTNLWLIMSPGSTGMAGTANTRFTMAALALVGSFATFLTAPVIAPWAFAAIQAFWWLVIIVVTVRGVVSLATRRSAR